jgi:hypothetical protein
VRGLSVLIGVTIVCVAGACGSERAHLGDEFTRPLLPPGEGNAETVLREVMTRYHMDGDKLDCFVDAALAKSSAERDGWTAAELNQYADRCGVDVSEMWVEITDDN